MANTYVIVLKSNVLFHTSFFHICFHKAYYLKFNCMKMNNILCIIVTVIVIILVLILLFKVLLSAMNIKNKTIGGYKLENLFNFMPYSFAYATYVFVNAKQQQMDNYCKSIAYYFFADFRDKKICSGIPNPIVYFEPEETRTYLEMLQHMYDNAADEEQHIDQSIDEELIEQTDKTGGFQKCNEIDTDHYIDQRYKHNKGGMFIPDFIIKIDDKNILIIEFDEECSFHQKNDNVKYIMKNLIYDQILCDYYSADPEYNVCMLRIAYNSNIIEHYKNESVRHFVSIIAETCENIKNKTFMNCYILAKVVGDRYVEKVSHSRHSRITYYKVLSAVKRDDLKTFEPGNPFYASVDLDNLDNDDKFFVPGVQHQRKRTDFQVANYIEDLKKHMYTKPMTRCLKSIIKSRTKSNIMDKLIDHNKQYKQKDDEITVLRKELNIRQEEFDYKIYFEDIFDGIIKTFDKYTIENSFPKT